MAEPATPRAALAGHSLRYLCGAVLCALINNAVLIVGHRAGLSEFAGVLAAWFLGGTTGYLWHHRISFAVAPSWRGYARFLTGSAISIPLAYLAVALFHQWLAWPMELAAPAATVALFAYNYLSARIALRRGPRPGS